MIIRGLAVLLVIATLTACQATPSTASADQPAWIDNPGDGAVGSATTHIKGRHYQEELAITRARERLAARYGVTISSVSSINEKVRNDNIYVRADHDIHQVITATEVRAQVRAVWHDQHSDTLWVWLQPIIK